ncbi:MAG: hypothetical protein ACM3X9_05485 [Bacillota bacterium]
MNNEKKIPIEELALLWVTTMIHHLRGIPSKLGENHSLTRLVRQDLLQFIAIAAQLEMLLCTRPANPWAEYFWRQNFVYYLTQIIRRSQIFFRHLSESCLEKSEG